MNINKHSIRNALIGLFLFVIIYGGILIIIINPPYKSEFFGIEKYSVYKCHSQTIWTKECIPMHMLCLLANQTRNECIQNIIRLKEQGLYRLENEDGWSGCIYAKINDREQCDKVNKINITIPKTIVKVQTSNSEQYLTNLKVNGGACKKINETFYCIIDSKNIEINTNELTPGIIEYNCNCTYTPSQTASITDCLAHNVGEENCKKFVGCKSLKCGEYIIYDNN